MPSATIVVGDVIPLANLLNAGDPNANRSRPTHKITSTR